MAYDDFDRTATLEKEDTSILDLIDERLSETEEIKRSELPTTQEESIFDSFDNSYETYEAPTSKQTTNSIDNPFFGDPDAITKIRNKRAKKAELLDSPQTNSFTKDDVITFKREETKVEKLSDTKMSARRRKMWIGTGITCGALLAGFLVCNIISISNINNNIAEIQNNIIVKEKTLTDLQGQISNQSSSVPEGMSGVNSTTIDASELYSTEVVTSDNVFNRIARFISYLLGK